MTVRSVRVKGNLSADANRGPSQVIWADCNVPHLLEDPSRGMYFFDDFLMAGNAVMTSAYKNSLGQWSVYADAGATLVDGALEGGVVKIGSDGDNEEVTLFGSAGAFRLLTTSTLALNGKLWFECSIAKSSIAATKADTFVGLALPALSSNIPASGQIISATDNTLNTTSLLGFHGKGNAPTDFNFAFCLSGGTVNYPTNLTTLLATAGVTALAAATFVKLGFIFDPSALVGQVSSATARQTAGAIRKKLLRVFVNGLELPAFLSSDDVVNATSGQAFPTDFMAPTISTMNQTGSSPPTLNVDWIRVAQVANS